MKDKEITMELTAEIVRELLHYNPNTGDLFWKERPLKYFKNEYHRSLTSSKNIRK